VENGDITEIGTHDELVKLSGKYAYMYGLQSHYYKENVEEAQENA
jgi:ATP-binding cassette subfamily B protein